MTREQALYRHLNRHETAGDNWLIYRGLEMLCGFRGTFENAQRYATLSYGIGCVVFSAE
jgi:hypothetical protein